jgi:hypothetical protein
MDWNGKFLTVRRTICRKKAKIPESGKERTVEMSDQFLAVLRDHKKAMTAEALKTGVSSSDYVFASRRRTTHEPSWIRKVSSQSLNRRYPRRTVPRHSAFVRLGIDRQRRIVDVREGADGAPFDQRHG